MWAKRPWERGLGTGALKGAPPDKLHKEAASKLRPESLTYHIASASYITLLA